MNTESVSSTSIEHARKINTEQMLVKRHLAYSAITGILTEHPSITHEELDELKIKIGLNKTQIIQVVGTMNLAYVGEGYSYQPTKEQLRSELLQ